MKWNRIPGAILLLLALVGLIVSIWPVSDQSTEIPFSIPDGLSGTLQLTQSNQMHLGENAIFRLKVAFKQDQSERQQIILISKLELDNLDVTPRGEGKVLIDPSKPVVLNWEATAHNAGTYNGTLWLFTESVEGERTLVLARPINLEATALLGFSYQSARIICFMILITGVFLLFSPFKSKKMHN